MDERQSVFDVEAAVAGRVLHRPPIVDLLCDLALANAGPETRWFLLPDRLDAAAPRLGEAGCNGVEVLAFGPPQGPRVGHFQGLAGFRAIRLAAGSKVRLRRLPFSLWEEEPIDSVDLEVVIAADFRVAGRPAADWVGPEPETPRGAELDASRSSVLETWTSPGLAAQPVEIDEVARIARRLAIRP